MNKEYKYLNENTIEIINELETKKRLKINYNNPTKVLELENKLEILDNKINLSKLNLEKKRNFIMFVPIWIKIHLLYPIITFSLLIISCLTGWIYTIFPVLLALFRITIAFMITSGILHIIKKHTIKDVERLKSQIEKMNEIKSKLELDLIKELIEPIVKKDKIENKTITLSENLSTAEDKEMTNAYKQGFNQKVKKRTKCKTR